MTEKYFRTGNRVARATGPKTTLINLPFSRMTHTGGAG